MSKSAGMRYPQADLARGIGIVLVVLGHALKQDGDLPVVMQRMTSVIYSFHMPLFFFLSGFVTIRVLSLQGVREKADWIRGRALRLLVPYFFVSLCYLPLKAFLSRYAQKPFSPGQAWRILLGESPDTMLWYLYVLFLLCLLSAILVRRRTLPAAIALSLAAVFLAPRIPLTAFSRLAENAFYFFLGLAARIDEESAGEGNGCLFGGWLTRRIRILDTVVFAARFICGTAVRLCLGREDDILWGILTALAGIRLVLAAASVLCRGKSPLRRMFLWLGQRSMDIYMMSDAAQTAVRIAAGMAGAGLWAAAVFSFAAGILLPAAAGELVVRRNGILRRLILGSS